ncbi:Hypothetical predicted protein [Lecanosticta acicola]|uniref:Uncharacterized protein n=1 Tax=Lecanosticta acicola TaxID=111012 RepID=A0AAI9E8H5_9PEZI|nr:Hypothetical predicted protein [Lecanosticta acicola]
MDRAPRRGSWARALDKVKAAVKRRPSYTRPLQTPDVRGALPTVSHAPPTRANDPQQPSQESEQLLTSNNDNIPTTATAELEVSAVGEALATTPAEPPPAAAASSIPAVPTAAPTEVLLAADTAVEADQTDGESDEPLLPMLSSRTGITEDRARNLFAKHGLQYDARGKRPEQEPPNKIRRVEKPVRLRVHWTCHECSRQFGIEKTCTACGHRRCRDCARHPPKRVREILENARQAMEEEQATASQAKGATAALAVEAETVASTAAPEPSRPRQQPGTLPWTETSHPKESARTQAPSVSGSLLGRPLEMDESPEVDADDEQEATMPEVEYSIFTRPRTGMHAVVKPRAQIVRRTCHKCDTPISPPSRNECQLCGHTRCKLCPRFPESKDKIPLSGSATVVKEHHPPMVKAVQRVYRKPRQRVRYTCERCRTLFMDSDRCVDCGHERCRSCLREPAKREPARHDPEVVRAVANRLAAYGGGNFGQPPRSITASAG